MTFHNKEQIKISSSINCSDYYTYFLDLDFRIFFSHDNYYNQISELLYHKGF